MKRTEPEFIEVDQAELQQALQLAERLLPERVYQLFKAIIDSHLYLVQLLTLKRITVRRLQKLLFGARTEKTSAVLGEDTHAPSSSSAPQDPAEPAEKTDLQQVPSTPHKGHGRNAADAYRGAEQIPVPHPSLQAGDACPNCHEGTVYEMRPGVVVRLVGQAPVQAKVYRLQKFRCNLCGDVFTAPLPDEAGPKKFDATVGSVVGLLKYGSGMPFNRLGGLQGGLGIPLPASTQWDIVSAKAQSLQPAFQELIRQAAQGDVLYNDDTTNKILDFMGKRAKKAASQRDSQEGSADQNQSERSGLFTSGIVSQCDDHQIAIFFTGRNHAGENLRDVLAQRAQALEPPIQMCDALSRNMPSDLQTILANCLAHGRRYFADVAEYFDKECRYVLKTLEVVYKNDAETRQRKLSPEERLEFHQAHSRQPMDDLHEWLHRQFDERLVEPNSGLGEAISYLLKHWDKLTLFLRQAGAPLDNNICERAMKKIILHRKNSYFYRSQRGARVGDLYMSLIYTCQLNRVNAFDYLTALERHADKLASDPQNWMPWNYRSTLESIATTPAVPTELLESPRDDHITEPAGQR